MANKIILTEYGTNKPIEIDRAQIIARGERLEPNGAKYGLIRCAGNKQDIKTVEHGKALDELLKG